MLNNDNEWLSVAQCQQWQGRNVFSFNRALTAAAGDTVTVVDNRTSRTSACVLKVAFVILGIESGFQGHPPIMRLEKG